VTFDPCTGRTRGLKWSRTEFNRADQESPLQSDSMAGKEVA
jgi:hypothetical protein